MFKIINELEKIVKEHKEKIGYKVNDTEITYEDLWNKASEFANSLRRQGNSPVMIYGHKSVNMIISIIGCLIANRTYIPIDTYTPQNRIEKMIKITKSTLLVKNEEIVMNALECLSIDEINQKYSHSELVDTSDNKTAYIIFTSGSTGEPKGVPISYDNLENFVHWISKVIPNEKLNIMNQASFSFDLSVADLYFSLWNGGTLIALEKSKQNDYASIFEFLKNEKINILVITPTFIKMLLMNHEFNEKNYENISCIYFCGEQLECITVKKLRERFSKLKIINAYGPTEATSAVSSIEITDEMLEEKYLPVGNVDEAAVKIEIIKDEIVLKGKSVFHGYINSMSENCYQEDGVSCYKTGDIGFIENNLLYCVGRMDSQVKYMGYRIELGDIECNLLRIEGIREAVVVPKYKEGTKILKNIKAFITVDKKIQADYIKRKLGEIVPSYMIPKTIIILEKIPINANGKYDRKKLNEL